MKLNATCTFFCFVLHPDGQFTGQLVRMGSFIYSLLCVLWKMFVICVQSHTLFIMYTFFSPTNDHALFFCTVPAAVFCVSIKKKDHFTAW